MIGFGQGGIGNGSSRRAFLAQAAAAGRTTASITRGVRVGAGFGIGWLRSRRLAR